MVYGYCRVSTKDQKIERQESNILKEFPTADIRKEAFTGTKIQGRKVWNTLYGDAIKTIENGEDVTIVFDEVSRMSRNAEEGFSLYIELFQKGINLVFLKEPHINTDTYKQALKQQINISVDTGKKAVDALVNKTIENLNEFILDLIREQIKLAFVQAQKEVDYLHTRTKEGMKANGASEKIRKARTGKKYETKKSLKAKAFIKKRNKGFGGDLTNEETWKLAGISKMTFYKYQKEIIDEEQLS